jgi:hypothetical protein
VEGLAHLVVVVRGRAEGSYWAVGHSDWYGEARADVSPAPCLIGRG